MTTVQTFFEHYADRYMASDVDAIASLYEAPFLAVRDGRAIHLPDATAVREHLAELMQAYAKSGAVRADIASLHELSLGPTGSIVTVHWHAVAADGSMVRDFNTSYHLLRDGDTWQILAYTNHA